MSVFTLSGRIASSHLSGLVAMFDGESNPRSVVLDLLEVQLVDRDAVKFLVQCEQRGMSLENCPMYVREWMDREKPRE